MDILSKTDRIVFDKIRKSKPINFTLVLQDILSKYAVKRPLKYFNDGTKGVIIYYDYKVNLNEELGYEVYKTLDIVLNKKILFIPP